MINCGEADLKQRMRDRYEDNIDELIEVLSITVDDIVDAFYDRIEIYAEDLDINIGEQDEHTT